MKQKHLGTTQEYQKLECTNIGENRRKIVPLEIVCITKWNRNYFNAKLCIVVLNKSTIKEYVPQMKKKVWSLFEEFENKIGVGNGLLVESQVN